MSLKISKLSLKGNFVVSFDSKNSNIFCSFFSILADPLLQKLPCPENYGIKTTGEYYKQIRNKCEDFILQNLDEITV